MLDWLQSTSVAIWLGESPSIWALPAVLTLHTTGMAVLVGASWMLNLRLLGISRNIPLPAFGWVFTVVGIGLAMNFATGILLFMKNATTWGTSVAFFVKMALVIISAATLLPLRAYVRQSEAAPLVVNSRARLLAVVSIVTWAGAVTAGRLLAYVMP